MNESYKKEYRKWYENKIRNEAAKIRNIVITDGCKCKMCGENDIKELQLHHIIPISINGDNRLDNLMCVCRNCHKRLHKAYRNSDNPIELGKLLSEEAIFHNEGFTIFYDCVQRYEREYDLYKRVEFSGRSE